MFGKPAQRPGQGLRRAEPVPNSGSSQPPDGGIHIRSHSLEKRVTVSEDGYTPNTQVGQKKKKKTGKSQNYEIFKSRYLRSYLELEKNKITQRYVLAEICSFLGFSF